MEKVALQSFTKNNASGSATNSSITHDLINGHAEFSQQNKKDTTIVELSLNSEKINGATTPQTLCIKEAVAQSMQQYFAHLGEQNATSLYQMVMNEVEPALLKAVIGHTRGNQSKAAEALGLNRGTLRKKLQQYGID